MAEWDKKRRSLWRDWTISARKRKDRIRELEKSQEFDEDSIEFGTIRDTRVGVQLPILLDGQEHGWLYRNSKTRGEWRISDPLKKSFGAENWQGTLPEAEMEALSMLKNLIEGWCEQQQNSLDLEIEDERTKGEKETNMYWDKLRVYAAAEISESNFAEKIEAMERDEKGREAGMILGLRQCKQLPIDAFPKAGSKAIWVEAVGVEKGTLIRIRRMNGVQEDIVSAIFVKSKEMGLTLVTTVGMDLERVKERRKMLSSRRDLLERGAAGDRDALEELQRQAVAAR